MAEEEEHDSVEDAPREQVMHVIVNVSVVCQQQQQPRHDPAATCRARASNLATQLIKVRY